MDAKIYLLFRNASQRRLYRDWCNRCCLPCESVDTPVHQWQVPDDAALIVTHSHYRWEELSVLRTVLKENRTPILVLADGILEYRNTWQHPGLPDGSIFQPLFGHKLACIGTGQARLLESWGNAGRCEVVGMPAFDSIQTLPPPALDNSSPLRLLVATATTPAFDEEQRRVLVQSLILLRDFTQTQKPSTGRKIEISWRINEDLSTAIGIEAIDETSRPPLSQALAMIDAVITTPSTLYLESILHGRPTAVLDFHNSPAYVPTAWQISAAGHIGPTIEELANPPQSKMQFQQFILQQQLQHQEPATNRMVNLVNAMAAVGLESRKNNSLVSFPDQILAPPKTHASAALNLSHHYPDNKVFAENDVQRLQIELSAAIERLGQLPSQVAENESRMNDLMATVDAQKDRIRSLHHRVKSLRQRFGVEPMPDNQKDQNSTTDADREE